MSKRVPIFGRTYEVREALKELGGRWDPAGKVWMVPADQAEAARALVDEQPHVPPGAQLWQPCRRRGCENEPSYVCCEQCAEHCRC